MQNIHFKIHFCTRCLLPEVNACYYVSCYNFTEKVKYLINWLLKILGFVFLKEKPTSQKIGGIVAIVCGIVMVKFA